MGFLLIFLIILSIVIQNTAKKHYNILVNNKGIYTYHCIMTFVAMLFFIITNKGNLEFKLLVLPYSFAFASSFVAALLFSFLAIRDGSLSLTSLATSYSLILPTIFGLVFNGEPIKVELIIGIILLMVAIFFINSKKTYTKITAKWCIYVFLAFLSNGISPIIQNLHQTRFSGKYINELMIVALFLCFVFFLIMTIINEKNEAINLIKKGFFTMILSGITNGAANLFVMLVIGLAASSIVFPVISAGTIILTILISVFIYKEKFAPKQIVGLILGIAAVVFLNI